MKHNPFWGNIEKILRRPQTHLIASFLPWILVSMIRSYSLLLANTCALLLTGLLNFKELRKGFVLPWGSAVVFAVLALNNLFMFSKWLEDNNYIATNFALPAIMGLSLVIGKPFTIQYAREEVDPSRWNHPIFLKINWVLSGIWTVLMIIPSLPHIFLSKEEMSYSWFWGYGFSILCILIGLKCNKSIPKLFTHK